MISPYLIRHEIIALHFAHEPQVYPVCFQAQVSSTGSSVPDKTVTFPEAYGTESISEDFETFDVHQDRSQEQRSAFVPPGPAVAVLGKGEALAQPTASSIVATAGWPASSSGPALSATSAASSQEVGEQPAPVLPDAPTVLPQATDAITSSVEPIAQAPSAVVDVAQPSAPYPSVESAQIQADLPVELAPEVSSASRSAAYPSTSGRGRGRGHRRPDRPR